MKIGFPSPSYNVVIDWFSPTCNMYEKKPTIYTINNLDFDPFPIIVVSTSRDIICNVIVQLTTKLNQGSKFTLANSQNASRNSVLRVENIGTRKKLRANSIFQLIPNPILVSKTFE